uniref:Uncharacterized protein n=1 Tax=Lepeophtheirus salmonis TaxID=72036 RepID=A0A0K2V651_LEPSM
MKLCKKRFPVKSSLLTSDILGALTIKFHNNERPFSVILRENSELLDVKMGSTIKRA